MERDEEGREGSGRRRELFGGSGEKGVAEGSGSLAGWQESLDRFLDATPRYARALRAAYSRFCSPSEEFGIPRDRLLPALQCLLETILEEMDEKAGKVCFRTVTEDDIAAIEKNDEALARESGHHIDVKEFDAYARQMLKRVAVDRSRRLGFFILGGLVVVHMAKTVVKRIPIVGGLVHALVPTMLAGPVVGVAGAIYM